MKFSKLAMAMVAALAVSGAVHAEESGTLQKIKDSGTITLGARDASIPFSYLDDSGKHIGYSLDLCQHIIGAIEKHLGVQHLNVKVIPVTGATRIPLMANGTIDLECGGTTNNAERQKQVTFAPTTFVTANRLLVKKSSGITKLADLKGKTLVASAGTSNLKGVVKLNAERHLGINIVAAKDNPEAVLMVETGRAAAFASDDIILAGLAATSKNPAEWAITKEALSVEPYGIMLRRDDPGFKKVVDQAIIDEFKSGDIKRLYSKWFQSPIPPKNMNLNVPMSEQLQQVIARPTDSPDPAAYKLD